MADPAEIARAAANFTLHGGRRRFVDVGAGVGAYSVPFARRGFDVLAVEVMLPNVLALQATACLNPELPLTVMHAAVAPPKMRNGTCTALSLFKSSDHGNAQVTCTNMSTGSTGCPANATLDEDWLGGRWSSEGVEDWPHRPPTKREAEDSDVCERCSRSR